MEFVNLPQKNLGNTILKTSLLIGALIILSPLFSQSSKSIPKDFCISVEEHNLYEKINQFLKENGNKSLSLSKSLCYVAKTHVSDLLQNNADTSICNLSSWSDQGSWQACCYNAYVPNPDCMWDKPKELTNFKYRGYELAFYFEDSFNSDSIMQLIYSSRITRDMLLAKGNYSNKKWISLGIGINRNYACIWFAQRKDTEAIPQLCDTTTIQTPIVSTPVTENSYYIIGASFEVLKDAREAIKRFKQNGFKQSGILKSGNNHRVYLNKFDSLKEAMYFKQKLPYTYNDAWILKE